MKTSPNVSRKPRLLFVCKKRYQYGDKPTFIASGLLNSATFVVDMLNKNGINAKIVDVVDNNSIDKEVAEFKPTHVIIEALWVVPQKFDILHRLHPDVKWIIRLHSETPFLANEGIAIEWLRAYAEMSRRNNVAISVNSTRALRDLQSLLNSNEIMYLPNYYPVDWSVKSPAVSSSPIINIGGFGAIRPLKNQFMQALAAKEFAESIGKICHFHINGTRIEGRGEAIYKNIKELFRDTEHLLVEHPWYDHPTFVNVVKQMDLGLQLSFSETYNIIAADFVNNNIPIVVSDEIRWMNWLYKTDPNELDLIMTKMKMAWRFKSLNLHKLNKIALDNNSIESKITWTTLFR